MNELWESPPDRDLPPGRLAERRKHLVSEIKRPERRTAPAPELEGRRRAWPRLVGALAAGALAVVGGVGIMSMIGESEEPVVLAAPETIRGIVAASWTPIPSQPSATLEEAALEQCDTSLHPDVDGALPLVILDQRGDGAMAYFAEEDEAAGYGFLCSLARVDGQWMAGANVDAAMGSGARAGNTLEGTVKVVIEGSDGSIIEGSVGGGQYLFWFIDPMPQDGTLIEYDSDGAVVGSRPLYSEPGGASPSP